MKFENEDQFLSHTIRHIKNVERISENMMKTIINSPIKNRSNEILDHFDIPNMEELQAFSKKVSKLIKVHDIAKINNESSFYLKHGFDEPIYKTLYKLAGTEIKAHERGLIDKINKVDKKETSELIKTLNLKPWERRLYDFIEHTSDIVDRGCNPITEIEMGRKVYLASEKGSDFRPKIEHDLVLDAEDFYSKHIAREQKIFKEFLFDNVANSTIKNKETLSVEPPVTNIKIKGGKR